MAEEELSKLTLRMTLPQPMSLQELSIAVEEANRIAPPSAKVQFLMRDVGSQRDPETVVVGLVTTWTPDA